MKKYIDYPFFQKQIILMIGLSLIPGIVYVVFGWINHILLPAVIWYILLLLISTWGLILYKKYWQISAHQVALIKWYEHVKIFMYIFFSLWTLIFVLYAQETENHLNYIAIFTQLASSVVASALLVSDRKLFIPIMMISIVPLALFFMLLDTWYGYVLATFTLIYAGVLLYATNNTYKLIQKNAFEANHDVLTGLHNRRYFINYMDKLLYLLKKNKTLAYLYFIDLDHFKIINDSLGHDIGDKLLQKVAQRIANFSSKSHTVGRIGGDEFAIISQEFHTKRQCTTESSDFAQKLLKVIKEPYVVDDHHLYLSASIGISYTDPHIQESDATKYMKEADIAMYEVKAQGRDGVVLFDKNLSDRITRELEIEKKLYFAFKNHQIELYYQPLFDKQESMQGCEVLTRWHDEQLGTIPPAIFIAIAEKTGLIIELGNYILKEAFQTLVKWEETGMHCKHFSINISVRQLLHDSFFEQVELLMKEHFSSSFESYLYFEVTESILAEDIPKVIAVMQRIKKLGIYFSMDDFGTGYSSLSYLRELPLDELKIDGSFIRHIETSKRDKTMVQTILSIAKTFDLKIVAEGVEKKEQLDLLSTYDCDLFQGYYFEKPLPQKVFFEKYIKT